jgi:hypothetical protein
MQAVKAAHACKAAHASKADLTHDHALLVVKLLSIKGDSITVVAGFVAALVQHSQTGQVAA